MKRISLVITLAMLLCTTNALAEGDPLAKLTMEEINYAKYLFQNGCEPLIPKYANDSAGAIRVVKPKSGEDFRIMKFSKDRTIGYAIGFDLASEGSMIFYSNKETCELDFGLIRIKGYKRETIKRVKIN